MKGYTNNPNGRPQGIPNKSTAEFRTMIKAFVATNMESIQKDFDQLQPKERLLFLEKLLGYIVPKMSETLNDEKVERPIITVIKSI